MFCVYCGKDLPDDAVVCIGCGRPIRQVKLPTQTTALHQNAEQAKYAGFWKRAAAVIIDGIILYAVNIVAFALMFLFREIEYFMSIYRITTIINIVIYWLYFALQESSERQATLGKRALRIVVTDLDGNRVSFGKATGRHFGKIVSSLILCVGYIMVAFTEKKQGLHDMMSGCLVLNKEIAHSAQ